MENYKNMIKTLSIGGLVIILIMIISFIVGGFIDLDFNSLVKISIITIPTIILFCIVYTMGSLIRTFKSNNDTEEHYNGSCEFCSTVRDRSKRIELMERSKYSDDNLFDILFNEDNKEFDGDQISEFLLSGYKFDDNFYLMVDYINHIEFNNKELKIHKFSNGFQLNYCPICGDKISKTIKKFEENYSIFIDDE